MGGPGKELHLLLILAADRAKDLEEKATKLTGEAEDGGLRWLWQETGGQERQIPDDPATDMRGREHFGFRDGLSQPAVRGRLKGPSRGQVPHQPAGSAASR